MTDTLTIKECAKVDLLGLLHSEHERSDLIKDANHDDKTVAAGIGIAIRQYVAVRKTG